MNDLDRVVGALVLNTEDARKAYAEEYGFAHGDARIDRELEQCFREALSFDPPRTKAEVPLHLLLALILRGRARGRPPTLTFAKQRKRAWLLADLRKKIRQRPAGESATQARLRVTEEGVEAFEKAFGEKIAETTMQRWLETKPRPRR